MTIERLFVYGSLVPGGSNEHVLSDIEGEWARGSIRGRLLEEGWGAAMGYPGLVIDDNGDDVPGFVLASDGLAEHWERLDEFEGAEYQRVLSDVTLENDDVVRAYVYVVRERLM